MGAGQLVQVVITVASVAIDPDRFEQPESVVMAQGLDRDAHQLRKVSDLEHLSPEFFVLGGHHTRKVYNLPQG